MCISSFAITLFLSFSTLRNLNKEKISDYNALKQEIAQMKTLNWRNARTIGRINKDANENDTDKDVNLLDCL